MQDFLNGLLQDPHVKAAMQAFTPKAAPPVSTMPVSQIPKAADTQVNLSASNLPAPTQTGLPSLSPGAASPRRGDDTTTGFQQFGQGLMGLPSKDAGGLPVTNPLDLTESQAMSPYGAGEAVGLIGDELFQGAKALGTAGVKAGENVINGTKDAIEGAQQAPGGLEAGFIKNPFAKEPVDTTGMTDAQAGRATQDNPTGSNPLQLNPTDLHAEYGVRSPQRVEEVQNTLNTEVPGSTPTEVYSNIQPSIENIGKQIDVETANNPSTVSKAYPQGVTYEGLASDMLQKANEAGLLKDPAVAKTVKQGIAQQINYIAGKGTNPEAFTNTPIFDDNLNPVGATPGQGDILAQKPLDMNTLRNEYLQANLDNKSVLARVNPMKGLNSKQRAQLLYRDSLKDAIGATNPTVQQLISKQHDLYDAADSAASASKEFEKSQSTAPKKGNFITDSPMRSAAEAIVGVPAVGYALSQIPGISGELGGLFQSNQDNADNSNFKPSNYSDKSPLETGKYQSQSDFNDQQNSLQEKIGAEKLGDPNQANIDQATYDNNANTFKAQQDIRDKSTGYMNVRDNANQAMLGLKDVDPGWFNTLSKGYDTALKANDGKYAGLAQQLQNLAKAAGGDITMFSDTRSKQAIASRIDKIVKAQEILMNNAISSYSPRTGLPPIVQQQPTGLPSTPQPIIDWQANDPRVDAIMQGSSVTPH